MATTLYIFILGRAPDNADGLRRLVSSAWTRRKRIFSCSSSDIERRADRDYRPDELNLSFMARSLEVL